MKRSILAAALFLLGCGSSVRQFPVRAPMTSDPDLAWTETPAPKEYVSPFNWDVANQTLVLPASRALAFEINEEAVNVNALDETPDSAWFTNRSVTPEEAARGACDVEDILDVDGPDGSFVIDHGKDNGASIGFRVKTKGRKYLFKAETLEQPFQGTASSTIGAALFRAAGFNVPCEQVVLFRRSLLKLMPGLTVTNNSGLTHALDDAALDEALHTTYRMSDGRIRMQASKWLSGKPIGPFRYQGTRDDDSLDVIPHEKRRDLRGARVLAAWINHWDAREQNTMDVWMTNGSKGHVLHHFLDFSDCLGGGFTIASMTTRLGYSYYFDATHITEDFLSFGVVERPWDRLEGIEPHPSFGYFSPTEFDPDAWHDGYPNPAFSRATERDNAWMARIVASRITEPVVIAIVKSAKLPSDREQWLTRTLLARRTKILSRYLSKVSPLGDVRVEGASLCATDFSRAIASSQRYVATSDNASLAVRLAGDRVCVDLPGDAAAYRVIRIANGFASGPLLAHVARGLLVGVERPS